MTSNKTVFFIIGILLVILGIFMMIPYGIQLIYNEDSNSFLASSIITIFIGILTVLSNLKKEKQLNLQQAFLFSTLAWFAIALFGSVPFMLSNLNRYISIPKTKVIIIYFLGSTNLSKKTNNNNIDNAGTAVNKNKNI